MSFQQYNVSPWLTPVRTVSTSNVSGTYNNGLLNNGVGATLTIAASSLTVDSVVMVVGDRLLLEGQTAANQNGIYVVFSIGSTVVLQRSADMQCIEQIKAGFYVTVGAGTSFAGSSFAIVEPIPAQFGISNLVFSQPGLNADAPLVVLGNISAGASGTAGVLNSFPAAATSGKLVLAAVTNASGNFNTTISNASAIGQSQVITIPDSGAATAKFLLDTGTNATATITTGTVTTLTSTTANLTNLKYGATPVAQVDPASCTISAAAGAANVSTVTIQLKDGSGTNMTRSVRFTVYSSSASDGLTLQGAASTGYSVASGGLSLANAAAITTQITAMSSATGGCVLSLTDTGKQTSYLVLVLPSGNKISAQLSAGSYG